MQKKLQNIFQQIWTKHQKEDLNQKSKKSALEDIKLLHELNHFMNVLQLYLKLNIKQNMEKVSKY